MPEIDEVLDCLERRRIRATYGAVAEYLNTTTGSNVIARGVSQLLGERCPRASWVVNARTREPTDYQPHEKHPDLHVNSRVLETGVELYKVLRKCREG